MRNDPFAKFGTVDQKLFSAQTPHQPVVSAAQTTEPPSKSTSQHAKEPRDQVSKESRKQASLEGRNLGAKPSWDLGDKGTVDPLDINQRPDRQNTYAFTTEELEGLEDLKILIRRRYDLAVTKNDLIRCAVHMLLDDYQRKGEGSIALARLRKKKER